MRKCHLEIIRKLATSEYDNEWLVRHLLRENILLDWKAMRLGRETEMDEGENDAEGQNRAS